MTITMLPTIQHHAVLITHTDRKGYATKLWEDLKSLSPAHVFFDQTVLDIGTARTIITWANTPYHEEKVALISFHTAGIDAQNAMLKILEEPNPHVKFILITSSKENLLGTVLSRLHHIEEAKLDNVSVYKRHAQEFLRTSSEERLNLPSIKKLLTKVDEEGRKDREVVKGFILALVTELTLQKANPHHINETIEMASYASDPSASGKNILSYLSLLLPQASV